MPREVRNVGASVRARLLARARRFAREDHPERVRGDGHVVSIYSEKRRGAGVAPGRFGPESEPIEDAPLLRAGKRS